MADTIDAVPDNQPTQTLTAHTASVHESPLDSGIADMSISSVVSEHSELAYRMDRRRGKLVLICNTQFDPQLKLSDRKGTEKDIAAIKRVFQDILRFEVIEYSQLKTYEMLQRIAPAALARDNKDCDCFAVFILTHGHEGGYVYGTEEKILISKLMKPLKDADVLAGKPKMVFIQACRGKELDRGKKVECEAESDGGGSGEQVTIPAEADFLYAYSTADGYVSFQNPASGSWFVQFLCSELEANWQQLEMMQMLTRVCRALAYKFASNTPSRPNTHNLKQISSVTTTLTKAIRFYQP